MGHFESDLELITQLKVDQVDVILADYRSIDFDVLRVHCTQQSKHRDVHIILSGDTHPGALIKPFLRGGISSFILKQSTTRDKLISIISAVHENGFALTDIVTTEVLETTWRMTGFIPTPCFNEREKKIFCMVCQGLNKKQIAKRIFLSEATVKYHLLNIFQKSEVTSMVELVIKGLNNKWVDHVTSTQGKKSEPVNEDEEM